MVVVSEAPIITMARPIVNAQYLASNPFGSLGHSPGYNVKSIPMASIPFSYGMPNFTSQFSNAIPVAIPNASIGIGGTTPPYTPFSFGGSQIPQMTPIWEACLLLTLGPILVLMGGIINMGDKFGLSFVLQSYLLSADSNQYIWHEKSSSILSFST